ncbi:SymE family type I addiction module toxin [Pantoea sp. RRHST58]|uniref:SymE family type I addiction module toxin n=1 Tax=Pantoea sp. RRHST58 TaxID=3425183 RepID=UPI003DA12254
MSDSVVELRALSRGVACLRPGEGSAGRGIYRYTGASRYNSRSPVLNLEGNWLQYAGFGYGQPVIVTAEEGRRIICLAGTE